MLIDRRTLAAGLALSLAAPALSACATPPGATASAVDPAAAGWNAAALDAVVAYVQSQKTTGFLILQNRKTVYEHNWPLPADAATFAANFTHGTDSRGALEEDVASAQKSFVAILAGIAIDKGLLDISRPVLAYIGPGWSKATLDQERAITVRNLMEMNSGLSERLAYDAPAGSKFFYNTPAYAMLKKVLEFASKQQLDAITRLWLTEPAGMGDTQWRQRPAAFAGVGNPTGLYTTPRDMGRLGQLILDKGKAANGKRVISEAQLAALFKPTATNPAYGRLWWLNGSDHVVLTAARQKQGSLIPTAPADLVAALGAQDRRIYVVPSRKLVVVRTGQSTPDKDFNTELWRLLMKAAPAA